ncbi:hypothetical protein F4778DRAFT_37288 [Xylariomycetidae sp. FL2044]|nr:hypothetical protein F4778DRAFT_37288 [Xylariomycetidae sp. FL2044]
MFSVLLSPSSPMLGLSAFQTTPKVECLSTYLLRPSTFRHLPRNLPILLFYLILQFTWVVITYLRQGLRYFQYLPDRRFWESRSTFLSTCEGALVSSYHLSSQHENFVCRRGSRYFISTEALFAFSETPTTYPLRYQIAGRPPSCIISAEEGENMKDEKRKATWPDLGPGLSSEDISVRDDCHLLPRPRLVVLPPMSLDDMEGWVLYRPGARLLISYQYH